MIKGAVLISSFANCDHGAIASLAKQDLGQLLLVALGVALRAILMGQIET